VDIRITADQSNTLFSAKYGAHYHSLYGALEESIHIFISAGLYHAYRSGKSKVSIFEMGLGTGLNAFLTLLESQKLGIAIDYFAIESDPVPEEIFNSLNYSKLLQLGQEEEALFQLIHQISWDELHTLTDAFSLHKSHRKIETATLSAAYDIIYFDAFSPSSQPQLWEMELHKKLYNQLNVGGYLVTYCTQGAFRRTLEAIGYQIEKLNGPGKKREMMRATKV